MTPSARTQLPYAAGQSTPKPPISTALDGAFTGGKAEPKMIQYRAWRLGASPSSRCGWPLGMPVVDHVDREIWEVRSRLANRLARVLFVLEGNEMVLLHGFVKKERTTPKPDLDLARQRLKRLRSSS
jgi:hypothetical protein